MPNPKEVRLIVPVPENVVAFWVRTALMFPVTLYRVSSQVPDQVPAREGNVTMVAGPAVAFVWSDAADSPAEFKAVTTI